MAPKKHPWFRMYVEAISDPKLRRQKFEHRWLWVALLAAARQSPQPGRLMLTDDEPLTADDLADFAGMHVDMVVEGMAIFERMGMLQQDGGVWIVTRWNDRQFESDVSTQRSQRHRSNGDATVNGTGMQRSSQQPCIGPETETETDTDKELELHAPSFDDWYAIYPRKRDPRAARKAWDSAVKRHGAQVVLSHSIPHIAAWNAWAPADRQYIPYPATFLNRDGFLGEVEQRKATATKQATNRERLLAQLAEARGRTSIEGTPALDTTAKETRP